MRLCETTKSKERVATGGEVFTPPHVVNLMCDLLEEYAPETTFLDPSVGQGQFPLEILRRKFKNCKSRKDFRTAALSVWGIDIQNDNLQECIENVLELCREYFPVSKALAAEIESRYILGDSLKIMPLLAAYSEKAEFVYVKST